MRPIAERLLLAARARLAAWRGWTARHHTLYRRLLLLVGLALLAAFALAVARNWQELRRVGGEVEWRWLAVAAALYPLSMAVQLLVWHDLMATLGGHGSLRGNAIAYSLVNLGKSLPGVLFHIGGRLFVYESYGVPRALTLRATLIEGLLFPLAGALCWLNLAALRAPGALRLLFPLALVGSVLALRALARWQGIPPGRAVAWAAAYALTWLNGLFFLLALVNAASPTRPDALTLWHIWLVGSLAGYAATYLLGGLSFLRELTVISLLARAIAVAPATLATVWGRLIGLASEVLWSALLLALLRVPVRSMLAPAKEAHVDPS